MKELALPVRHDWLVRERAYGKIVIEPFEPGFALTAGNAYRRVLLSSIAGAAPTWVKIESVLHEFSYLPGCPFIRAAATWPPFVSSRSRLRGRRPRAQWMASLGHRDGTRLKA